MKLYSKTNGATYADSEQYGQNVKITAGQFNIFGGEVVNGGVYAQTDSVTIGGSARIESLYLKDAKLTVSTEKPFVGSCGVTVLDGTVIAIVPSDVSALFTSSQGNVSWNSETKELYIA